MKCLCFALVSLAVTGDIKLSVGETILRDGKILRQSSSEVMVGI